MILASIIIIILGLLLTKGYFLVKRKNETEKMLEKMANTDFLTEVNTRSYGASLVGNEISKNKKISIGIIDIDNFKNINDTYGHIFGDMILKSIARELKESIDNEDIVYRFTGEEFVVAFVGKNKDIAKEKLDEIRISINNEVSIST